MRGLSRLRTRRQLAGRLRRLRTGGVLIDASNLHSGGAVQVATSFILELDYMASTRENEGAPPWLSTALVRASDAVMAGLDGQLSGALVVERENRRWRSLHAWLQITRPFAVQFTVFGPYYGWRRGRRHVVGFADVTSLYSDPFHGRGGTTWTRLRKRVRKGLTLRLFSRADELVAETQVVKDRIANIRPLANRPCRVVPNTYNSIFDRPDAHRAAPTFRSDCDRDSKFLLYVSRAYPHKNHELLGQVARMLRTSGEIYRFVVTLTEDEWSSLSDVARREFINVGPVAVAQLPDLYRQADAVIFPSLLECFSATPVEAMRTRKSLIASDRDFVRDLFPGVAFLFDPYDPQSAVHAIRTAFANDEERARRLELGSKMVESMPGPRDRAVAYVEIIDSAFRWHRDRIAGHVP